MPSRKRLQGKLQKVKAQQDPTTVSASCLVLHDATQCRHGCEQFSVDNLCYKFVQKFEAELKIAYDLLNDNQKGGVFTIFQEAIARLSKCNEYNEIWRSQTKQESIQPILLSMGCNILLKNKPRDSTNLAAAVATAVLYAKNEFDERKACAHGTKTFALLRDLNHGCLPGDTIRFFKKRIPCQCLNKLYSSVKDKPKMGVCQYCKVMKERKLLFLCGKCCWVHYCGKACQRMDYQDHLTMCERL